MKDAGIFDGDVLLADRAPTPRSGHIVAALRDLARQLDRPGSLARPELGAGVRSWHLRLSRGHVNPGAGIVRRPRHFLVYRMEPGLVVVGRVLHDAMELARHLDPDAAWK